MKYAAGSQQECIEISGVASFKGYFYHKRARELKKMRQGFCVMKVKTSLKREVEVKDLFLPNGLVGTIQKLKQI